MAGSIEKRGKNSYRLSCLAGYNLQGKPIKKTKTVHGTKKEAEIELAKFVADVQNGMVIEGKSLKFSKFYFSFFFCSVNSFCFFNMFSLQVVSSKAT